MTVRSNGLTKAQRSLLERAMERDDGAFVRGVTHVVARSLEKRGLGVLLDMSGTRAANHSRFLISGLGKVALAAANLDSAS